MKSNVYILFLSIVVVVAAVFFVNRTETYADPLIDDIKGMLMKVDPEVASKLNIYAGNQSYTQDKKDMYLCLRDKNTGQYYPKHMLTYVALHELAHAKSKTTDVHHSGREFQENFEYYLKKAEELGFYDPSKPLLEEYCGVTKDMK